MQLHKSAYSNSFAGDKKVGKSLLSKPEIKLKELLIPYIPKGIETYHLTLATIVWSVINMITAFFVAENLALIWLVSFMIVLQYITDLLDGEIGRRRETGLVKWGFYMDHFLDYLFLCSLVFVGYMLSPASTVVWFFGLLVVVSGFMVNSFLSFGATNEFEIYHFGIGPTEMRLVFILINTYIFIFGTTHFPLLLPLTVIVCCIGLIINSYQIHLKLWRYDMAMKSKELT